jgi:hypothetical protein
VRVQFRLSEQEVELALLAFRLANFFFDFALCERFLFRAFEALAFFFFPLAPVCTNLKKGMVLA